MKTSIQLVALPLLCALTACSGAPAPETASRPGGPVESQPTPGEAPITRALDEALASRSWQNLRIDSECQDESLRLRSVRLFGSGVGIWSNERQFAISRERLLDVLSALSRAGFGAMRDSYGGKEDPAPTSPQKWGLEMICRVRVALDGAVKQSFQLSEGRQSAELKSLAEQILAVGAEIGPSGVAASSLEDGLDKIARGELAPETLTLQLQRQPEDPRSQDQGWLLRIEDGQAQVSLSSPETGWTEPRRVRLTREEAAGLARRLAAAHPEDLPVNLYSSWYQDLEIRVLNRRTSLQARRFANVTPETHGAKQERFEQIVEALEELKSTLTD